jgi:hypothetical protein
MYIADILSRTTPKDVSEDQHISHLFREIEEVNLVVNEFSADDVEEILLETEKDVIMQKLKEMVCMNWSDNCDLLRQYASFGHDIAIHNGLLLKWDRALRNKYVKLAHNSHQGIESVLKKSPGKYVLAKFE